MAGLNPNMFRTQIHQVHIADGFADDCEELIHRWLKTDTLTYETFCEIWKAMQFDLLYHGRQTGAEIAELSEEIINIAKHYMVTNPDNFEESVAGLFLVYALINLQPYPGFAHLRIIPEDVPAITQIETVARRTRRYDVLYILGAVLMQGPVQYQAVARERGMETSFRKYLEGTTGIDRLGVRPKGVFFRQNEELDLLRELNSITRRYSEAKKVIPGSKKSLNYINENLGTELDSSLKEIINGILDDGEEANKKISDHYSTVQAIKEKAMRQTVDSVKYLNTVSGTSTSKQTKKPAPVKRTTKQCTVKVNSRRKRTRKRMYKSSSSETDSAKMTSTDEDLNDSQDSQGFSEEDEIRELASLIDNDLKEISHQTPTPAQEQVKEIDIEIESLPVIIRSEQGGNMVEIEIIDKLKKPDVSDEKAEKGMDLDHGEATSKTKNTETKMAEICKIEKVKTEKKSVKKPDKKKQKQESVLEENK